MDELSKERNKEIGEKTNVIRPMSADLSPHIIIKDPAGPRPGTTLIAQWFEDYWHLHIEKKENKTKAAGAGSRDEKV
jgi:hypothetical protein